MGNVKSKLSRKSKYYHSIVIVNAYIGHLKRSRNCKRDINIPEIQELINSYYKLIHRTTIKYAKHNAARTNRRDKRNRNVSWPHGTVLDYAHSPEISGRLVLHGLPATQLC